MIHTALIGNSGLVSPTMPHSATKFDAEIPKNTACFTAMASITGLPAVVLPIACSDGGLPQSLHLVARTTAGALQLANRVERCLDAVPASSPCGRVAPPSLG
jgi:Asp-tRNA(Asn)/Glu-tRNA(Gln) amidotransferase A subunit family amidase